MENLITEQLQNNFVVKVFGEAYSVLSLNLDKDSSPILKQFGKTPTIVKVVGIKTFGACIKLDKPKYILLPGNGENPDDCGFEDNNKVKMWEIDRDFDSLSVETNPISISDLATANSINSVDISVRLGGARYSEGVFTGNVTTSIVVYGISIPVPAIPIRVTIGIGGNSTVYNQTFPIAGGSLTIKVKLKLRSANRACAVVEATGRYGPFSVGDDKEVCVNF